MGKTTSGQGEALADLARLRDAWLPYVLTVTLLGVNVAGGAPAARVLAALAANVLCFAFGFMFNDLEDAPDDARNPVHSRRNPVASGRLSRGAALKACAVAAAGSALACSFLGGRAAAAGAAGLALGFAYSWRALRLKGVPLLDLALHAVGGGPLQFLCGFLAGAAPLSRAWPLAAMLASVSLYAELYNETRDLASDVRSGILHSAARLGLPAAQLLRVGFAAAAVLLLRQAVLGRLVPFWVIQAGAAVVALSCLWALARGRLSSPAAFAERLHRPVVAGTAALMAAWTVRQALAR